MTAQIAAFCLVLQCQDHRKTSLRLRVQAPLTVDPQGLLAAALLPRISQDLQSSHHLLAHGHRRAAAHSTAHGPEVRIHPAPWKTITPKTGLHHLSGLHRTRPRQLSPLLCPQGRHQERLLPPRRPSMNNLPLVRSRGRGGGVDPHSRGLQTSGRLTWKCRRLRLCQGSVGTQGLLLPLAQARVAARQLQGRLSASPRCTTLGRLRPKRRPPGRGTQISAPSEGPERTAQTLAQSGAPKQQADGQAHSREPRR